MKRRDLIGLDAAAELAGRPRRTLEDWTADGRLPVLQRRRGRVLVERAAVLALASGTCECCGTGFRRARVKQRFCSGTCRREWHRRHKAEAASDAAAAAGEPLACLAAALARVQAAYLEPLGGTRLWKANRLALDAALADAIRHALEAGPAALPAARRRGLCS